MRRRGPAVNIKEGTRRAALFLGAAGALIGGYVSFLFAFAPSAWNYLWIPLFPLLGFVVPWGVVRMIGWVIAGFAKSTT
jgi:hypothetical protein